MIALGRIISLEGKKGELEFRPYRGAENLLTPGKEVYLEKEKRFVAYRIEYLKKRGRKFIIKLSGVDSGTEVLFSLGKEILIPEDNLPRLSEDEFYEFELIGALVKTRDQVEVGQVTGFWEISSKTLMVVEKNKKEILIPFEKSICVSIDVASKIIIIDPPEGLLNLNEI